MKAVVVVPIRGSGNAWKVAEPSDPAEQVQERMVVLEIQGSTNDFHLVMSPTGCFTADTWHESIADANETATEVFGVAPDAWV